MTTTTLLLRLPQRIGRHAQPPPALRTLVFGLAILTMSVLTGCGEGVEADIGPILTDALNPASGGSNGSAGNSNGSGSGSPSGSGGSSGPIGGAIAASLAWDPVTDPSILGYIVHFGKRSPGSYGSCAYEQATFSSSPSVTVTGLMPNTAYYFAVSAFNGLESSCSAEAVTVTGSI
ncbi:MAG: fibronectin type III domain-containing protein [Nitrospira sp.]